MYRLKLELDGYHVAVVADDDRVLEEAARTRPDMIYIDLRVGDERRFATLQQLRATTVTRDLPVIILSNLGASELTAQGYKADLRDRRGSATARRCAGRARARPPDRYPASARGTRRHPSVWRGRTRGGRS